MSVFNRILLPYAPSDLSDDALDVAVSTAVANEAELVILHVESESVGFEDGTANEDLDLVEVVTKRLLAGVAATAAKRGLDMDKVRVEVRAGPVAQVIHAAVEELLCDLVVMATHGRKGIMDMITGSTTEQVLRNTPASVFVVRAKGYPYLTE